MNKAIGDRAAIQFATEFYKALATGGSFDFAYRLACNSLNLASIPEALTPEMLNRRGINDPFNLVTPIPSQSMPLELPPEQAVKQAQSFGNITFSGSNNPFNAIQSTGNVNVTRTSDQIVGRDTNLEAALAALGKLKQVAATAELSTFAKKDTAAKIEMLREELQKPQPDKSFVDEVLVALQQGLKGSTLAESVTQVATLVVIGGDLL